MLWARVIGVKRSINFQNYYHYYLNVFYTILHITKLIWLLKRFLLPIVLIAYICPWWFIFEFHQKSVDDDVIVTSFKEYGAIESMIFSKIKIFFSYLNRLFFSFCWYFFSFGWWILSFLILLWHEACFSSSVNHCGSNFSLNRPFLSLQ